MKILSTIFPPDLPTAFKTRWKTAISLCAPPRPPTWRGHAGPDGISRSKTRQDPPEIVDGVDVFCVFLLIGVKTNLLTLFQRAPAALQCAWHCVTTSAAAVRGVRVWSVVPPLFCRASPFQLFGNWFASEAIDVLLKVLTFWIELLTWFAHYWLAFFSIDFWMGGPGGRPPDVRR